jgi:transcriptional repressor NrdR
VCKRRFTTYEKLGAPALKVTKRDGSSEPFDGDKLVRALARVCAHRPAVRPEDLRRIARDLEATLLDSGQKVVRWSDIVTHALARLENVDTVAARRLAANYLDETGALRLSADGDGAASPQLGLPLAPDEE